MAAASFNPIVVGKLVDGAVACFASHEIADGDVFVAWVPGAFELPLLAKRLASTGAYDGIVCVGAVIRGDTDHFRFIAAEAARGIQSVMLDTGVPVTFGVLTTDSLEQALDRAGGKHGNKGWDSAMAVMEMASVLDQVPKRE